MPKKLERQSAPTPLAHGDLFGPPPIFEGEDAGAYNEIVDRVFNAVGPTDFVEEIWVRDLADVTWEMFRWRRILAALVSDEVSKDVDYRLIFLVDKQIDLMEGPEREEMDSEQNRWANKKYQELWSAVKSTLDVNLIQGEVLNKNLKMIERINDLILIAQRRIDEVMRELDRHRFMQAQLNSFQDRQESKLANGGPKLIEGKALNKKIA